jgi:deoxyadenosine/deoxycytidine kinase
VSKRKKTAEKTTEQQSTQVFRVEELNEEEIKQLIEKPMDMYTKTVLEMIDTIAGSEKPLKFTVEADLDFDTLLRKLDYRVRKFNKRNHEFKITYRVYPNTRQIIMWKIPK